MRTAEFSEFSYGYAITDNFLHAGLPSTGHAPVFPSLIAEGTAGGYDVQIPLHPIALFLQFKIPQVMQRHSDKRPAGFSIPYLRMHLRTTQPNQHQLLLDWEHSGHLVYYATPRFWRTEDLNTHFYNQRVHHRSWYFRPSQIGYLDETRHHVAYQSRTPGCWRYSTPEKIEPAIDYTNLNRQVSQAIEKAPRQNPIDFLEEMTSSILKLEASAVHDQELASYEVVEKIESSDEKDSQEKLSIEGTTSKAPMRSDIYVAARRLAYTAQSRLDCTVCIVGRD